jgi:general secretion pathway protein D
MTVAPSNVKGKLMRLSVPHWLGTIACWVLLGTSSMGRAESPPGGPTGVRQPPPPGAGAPISDEDEFPGDANFGFAPPPKVNNAPPSSIPAPSNRFGSDRNAGMDPANRTPPLARPLPSAPPISPAAKSAATAKASQQKLADYLELDSSVKGLEVKNFDLPDKDIKDVVTLISKWTGKNFILDNKVRGKITIIGPSQVTLQEAYQAFLSALEANGLTTVQSGKFIRIIESAEARRAPVKTYSGEFAPKDDQFITRIFQLKYINADEVQREFRDLTTRQGKLFAYEPTNSIIITDTGSNIQRIKEILETLDIKNFETTLHVLHIRNTSAKQISEMLGAIYGEDKSGGSAAARSFRRSALERTRGGGLISKIIPDEQTNSLLVLANAAGFTQLEKLVDRLDVKVTDTGRIHVYYCEYAKAEDLAATLAALTGSGGPKTAKSNTSVTSPNSVGTTPPRPTGTSPAGPTGPVSAELEGGVRVTSDAATNALVITANASDYKTLKRVIKKLDIPRLQVFVETAIIEVDLGDQRNVGMNLAAGAPGSRAFAGGFIGDATTITNFISGGIPEGATIPAFIGQQFQGGGPNGTTITVASFIGLLNLLTKTTNTSVLSTPQIIALDNEKAEFKVIDETPVQSSFTLSAGAQTGNVGTGTIDRLKTGIEIKLTPHINAASRTVRLEIEQKVDDTKANSSVPTALAQIQIATTSRVTNTSVVVRDQDYIMLGGLMSDKVVESVSKVPLLGDIPILGWLFKSKTLNKTKTNLVILLRPKIIGTSLASAETIKENLDKRDDFLSKYNGGDDPTQDGVNEIKDRLGEQEKRGRNEPFFDYRNNDTEEDDRDKERDKDKIRPGEVSELTPKKEKNSQVKVENPNDQDLLGEGSTSPPGGNPGAPPIPSANSDAPLMDAPPPAGEPK